MSKWRWSKGDRPHAFIHHDTSMRLKGGVESIELILVNVMDSDATYLGICDDGIGSRIWRREDTEIVNGIN